MGVLILKFKLIGLKENEIKKKPHSLCRKCGQNFNFSDLKISSQRYNKISARC